MKILVETTGAFQLVHTELNEHVRSHGKTIIEKSQWAQEKVSIGQLLVVAQLSDDATDAEIRAAYSERKHEVLPISCFCTPLKLAAN